MDFQRLFTGVLCNNNCLFCFNGKDNKDKDYQEIIQELGEFRKNYDNISFYGGEVPIRKDFFDIVSKAKEMGFQRIRVETNGRIFASREFSQRVVDSGVTDFLVSFYGFCKDQHDYLTRTPGSFRQTVKGIKNLNNLGQRVSANAVIVKPNYRDLVKFLRVSELLEMKNINFEFVHPKGNALENFESMVPRYSIASPVICRAIEQGIKKSIGVSVSSIPFCFLPGFENYVNNIGLGKTLKLEKCEHCFYKNECSGILKNYIEKSGEGELKFLRE